MGTIDAFERYCRRIGLDPGELRGWFGADPTAAMTRLIEHHCVAIPFENFDGLTRGKVELGQAAVDKLLARRGGYCHEHVDLLATVFDLLGLDAM